MIGSFCFHFATGSAPINLTHQYLCLSCLSQHNNDPLPFTPPSVPRNERGRNNGYKRPYVVIASAKHASPTVDNATTAITEFKIKVSCGSTGTHAHTHTHTHTHTNRPWNCFSLFTTRICTAGSAAKERPHFVPRAHTMSNDFSPQTLRGHSGVGGPSRRHGDHVSHC